MLTFCHTSWTCARCESWYELTCLRTLRIRGLRDTKTHEVKPPLSERMLEELRGRCPALSWLYTWNLEMWPTCLVQPFCQGPWPTWPWGSWSTWQPRWLKDCANHFTNLVYLDFTDTVRVDNHDMKDIAHFTKLHTLMLDNCYRLSEQEGLQEIVKALTLLTSLSLRGCDTSDLVVHHIGRHLTALQYLDLSGSKSLTESFVCPCWQVWQSWSSSYWMNARTWPLKLFRCCAQVIIWGKCHLSWLRAVFQRTILLRGKMKCPNVRFWFESLSNWIYANESDT